MAMTTIGRLVTAMVPPFDGAGQVDYAQVKRLAQGLVASGTEALVVSGTTGESPTLSAEEKLGLYQAVKEAVGDRATVIAGTTTYNTAESVHLTREADSAGFADAFLLTVPLLQQPAPGGALSALQGNRCGYRQAVRPVQTSPAARCGTWRRPPPFASVKSRTIVGVKEASGNLDQITKVIQGVGPDFRVWERQRQRYAGHTGAGRLRRGERGEPPVRPAGEVDDRPVPVGRDGPRGGHPRATAAAGECAVHHGQSYPCKVSAEPGGLLRGCAPGCPWWSLTRRPRPNSERPLRATASTCRCRRPRKTPHTRLPLPTSRQALPSELAGRERSCERAGKADQ